VGLFNLFKIIYTILPVEDLASNHKVLKPRLEPQAWASKILSWAQAHCKPSSGLGWAGLGLGLDGLSSVGSGLEARPSTSLDHRQLVDFISHPAHPFLALPPSRNSSQSPPEARGYVAELKSPIGLLPNILGFHIFIFLSSCD
jgi:hypothetical protein